MSARREAAATMLAVAIGATGALAITYPHRWPYGVAAVVAIFAWIWTVTGTPDADDPLRPRR